MSKPRQPRKPIVKEPVISDRLEQLKGEKSARAFAAECEVDHRRLANWLRGDNAPDAENLRQIAQRTGVSVDWLLGLPEASMFRGISRDRVELETDLAAYTVAELNRRLPPTLESDEEAQTWVVDGAWLLRSLIDATISVRAEAIHTARQTIEAARTLAAVAMAAASLLHEQGTEILGERPEEGRAAIEAAEYLADVHNSSLDDAMARAAAMAEDSPARIAPRSPGESAEEPAAAVDVRPMRARRWGRPPRRT